MQSNTATIYAFDLRSDIVGPASSAVATAIAKAAQEPGEFSWRKDAVEQLLEARVRELLKKDAVALFPTCTAANIAGLVALGAAKRPMVLDKISHLMTNEMNGLEWLARPRVAFFTQVADALDIADCATEQNAIFCLENTHNRRGGAAINARQTERMADVARRQGWSVFLDGSRLWNASVASGDSAASLAMPVDLVSVSFNKGLGAPNGAALAGKAEIIDSATEAWRRIGGICRPSRVLAAGALAALDNIPLLERDHKIAKETATAISLIDGLEVSEPQTNIVLVSGRQLGLDGIALSSLLAPAGLGCLPFGGDLVRLVFHRGIPAGSAPAISSIFQAIATQSGCLLN